MTSKKIIAMAAMALCIASCSDDDNNGGGSSIIKDTVGSLSSGTSADKDLPEGYRIKSVGDISYSYDSDGLLYAIDNDGDEYEVKSKPFTISYSDRNSTQTIKISLNSSGYISGITGDYQEEYDGEKETSTASANYSYNSKGQLASASTSSKYVETEDGKRYTSSESTKLTFTYDSNNRLKTVKYTWEEKDDHVDRGTEILTFEYDGDYQNTFYQYTPEILDMLDGGLVEYLGYLGLYGKASSALPTSVTSEETEYCENDKKEETYSNYRSLGPYRFNSYGAISSADGDSYSYTTISTRAVMNLPEWPISFDSERKDKKHSLLRHHHSKHRQ